MLYLVGTPIGNMKDLSSRAIEILQNADLIACEDTRRTGILLSEFNINGKLLSYHEHNKASKGEIILRELRAGKIVAQVSDAGMPAISDPGADLVKLCIENDIDVSVVPGPVAAITALVMSGLDTRYYHFEGFLPSDNKNRRIRLQKLKSYDETIIIYEAPHRLNKLIDELIENGFAESSAAFCRELTKKFEQVIRLTINDAKEYFEQNLPRGEFVLCLEPQAQKETVMSQSEMDDYIRKCANEKMSTKQIASELANITNKNKKDIYDYIVNLLK